MTNLRTTTRQIFAVTFVCCVVLAVLRRPICDALSGGDFGKGFYTVMSVSLYILGVVDRWGFDAVGMNLEPPASLTFFVGFVSGVAVTFGFWIGLVMLTCVIYDAIRGKRRCK